MMRPGPVGLDPIVFIKYLKEPHSLTQFFFSFIIYIYIYFTKWITDLFEILGPSKYQDRPWIRVDEKTMIFRN